MAVLFAIIAGLFCLLIDPTHSLNNGKLRSVSLAHFFSFFAGLGLTPPMGWDTWCTEQK